MCLQNHKNSCVIKVLIKYLYFSDKEEKKLAPKKSVSFESLPLPPEQSTGSINRTAVEKSGSSRRNTNKNINSKAKINSSPSEKLRNTINKKNIVGDQNLTNKFCKEQIKNKIGSTRNKNDKPFKNTSGSKERTVVGQVVKHLSTKKSILKNDSASQKPPVQSSSDNKENLNALFEVVDDRETSREFEFWIKERSLKIQNIHDELNKIVEGSTEKYLHAQQAEYSWLERPTVSDGDATRTGLQERNLSFKQTMLVFIFICNLMMAKSRYFKILCLQHDKCPQLYFL